MKPIVVIDGAVERSSIHCFNRITRRWKNPFTYHRYNEIDFDFLDEQQQKAMIVFGSATNVTDGLKWHKDLGEIIQKKLEQNIPVFGICFAHQLFAHLQGSKVDIVHPDGHKNTGTREIEIIKDGFGYKSGERFHIVASHGYEIKNLSSDFIHLGTSNDCFYDAITHRELPFISFQGHPEASTDFIEHMPSGKMTRPENIPLALNDGIKIVDRFISQILDQ
ncbi:MAG: gamma-glutamyl-gamma-aminobutyrate hydrolase family protein [Bacteriovoracaceae bacterium]|nr:gamma-glutamyl-gamma-aminobutyrate hydrolase family protein [Bacteriovoracaceae bacterium]